MEIRPQVLFDRPAETPPRVSLVLLDWSCRESFHIFDYLAKQDVPRAWFEVLWIEYYDHAAPEIGKRISDAHSLGDAPPVDRWIVLNMPRSAYYHKHLMYNVGAIASRGDLLMIADSDAMVTPTFVRTVVDTFERDRGTVLHLDEVRSHNRRFYPFNYPSFDEVLGDGVVNWQDGKTTGVLEQFDPLHVRNYGACFCAPREDVIAVGGADEHNDYLGHVCGPYDLTWRLVNIGRREVWHETEYLYHVWHPGSDGEDNYVGPHDGRNLSTLALETRRTGRVTPLVENPVIQQIREGRSLLSSTLEDVISRAIGERPLREWAIDDVKRALSAGRTALTQRRYQDAVAAWEPLRSSFQTDSRFLNDLGWSYYFLKRYKEAQHAFVEAIRLAPNDPDAHRGLAWTLAVQGQHPAAIEEFTTTLGMADPVNRMPMQEAYRGRAWSRFHLGESGMALADFGSALELIPPSDLGALQDVERGLGWCQLRRGARTLAAAHFGRALRALDARRGPEYDDAAAGLDKASKADKTPVTHATPTRGAPAPAPPKPEASQVRLQGRLRADLGEAFYRVGLYQHALAAYQEALAIDKRSSQAACGMGWAALKIGRLSEASAAFRRVKIEVGVDPSLVRDTQHGLGWIAYREGNVTDAIKHFRRALKGADPKREAALVRDIERGLRRAQYLAGAGNVTLQDLARSEGRSRVDLALRLQGRAMANRLSRLVGRGRVNR